MSADAELRPQEFGRNLIALQYREVMMTGATVSVIAVAIGLFPGPDDITVGIQSGVTEADLLLFVAVALVAGVIRGVSGFGFALVLTPIFATVVEPGLAVAVLVVPSWMMNVFQVGETRTGLEFVRREWSLLALALVGSVLGVFFLSAFSVGPLVLFLLALILLAYVGFELTMNFAVVEEADHPAGLGIAGFSTGFLMGAANVGPTLPAYLHTFERNTERYVGGLSMVFLFVTTERIVQMVAVELLTPYRLWLGSIIAIVALVGLFIGSYVRRLEFDERKFNWLVVGILFVIALNLLRETVPILFL